MNTIRVRTGSGTVRPDGTFTDVVETISREVCGSPGHPQVRYKGRRYSLRGGIRTDHFITLSLPMGKC